MVFQWQILLRSGFPTPEMELTGSIEKSLMSPNDNVLWVQVCPELK